MKDAIVTASCCCGAAGVAMAAEPKREGAGYDQVERQACCETRPTVAVLPHGTRADAAPEPVLLAPSIERLFVLDAPSPPASAPAWACSPAMRDPGRPIVLLKHALLV